MKILLIAGCNVEFTPVVNSYIKYLNSIDKNVEVVEFVANHRIDFVWRAMRKLFEGGYSKLVFVNFQSLPILFFASFFWSKKLIYWKLESYLPFENWSFVTKLQLLEWILNRKSIDLILPTQQRAKVQKPIFKNTYVLPNAPFKPYISVRKYTNTVSNLKNINLIIYGNSSSPGDIYLNEWTSLVKSRSGIALTVVGQSGTSNDKIKLLGRLPHAELIGILLSNEFHYSIVGYRNKSSNTLLAAPNKLIESLSCGIPVIGNVKNPYVAEIVNLYKCGILLDFDCLDFDMLLDQIIHYPRHSNNALLAANELCLLNQVNKTTLKID